MLGIIILNYNDWTNLINCVNSISTKYPHRIYVVDNGMPSSNHIKLLENNDKIVYIKSEINGGYSHGNNIGLKNAQKDNCNYYLISNSDIIFESNSIDRLLDPLINLKSDIVAPRVILSSGIDQEEILGIRVRPIDKIKLILNSASSNLLFKKYRALFNNTTKRNLNIQKVYGVSGCCFAFNKTVLDTILPFDENLFLFNEEWLFAEKAFRKGFQTNLIRTAIVSHLHGSTTNRIKYNAYKYFIKSEVYVLNTLFSKNILNNKIILLLRMPKLLAIYLFEKFKNSKN